MEPQQHFQQSPELSADQFISHIGETARPAIDTPLIPPDEGDPGPGVNSGDSGSFFLPPPPPGAEPVFPDPDLIPEPPAGPIKPLPKSAAGVPLETFLKLRNKLQSRLFALVAKSNNRERYELSEDDLELLMEAWLPYAQQFGGAIPPWLLIMAVELITTGEKFLQAMKDRSAHTASAKAVAAPGFRQSVSQGLARTTERKKFSIDAAGFYINGLNGKYLKIDDRKERATLEDVEKLIEVNGIEAVSSAFPDWPILNYANA